MNKGKLIYATKEKRGYVARAWELPDSKGDALIQIAKGDSVVREFLFPAYKVLNIIEAPVSIVQHAKCKPLKRCTFAQHVARNSHLQKQKL